MNSGPPGNNVAYGGLGNSYANKFAGPNNGNNGNIPRPNVIQCLPSQPQQPSQQVQQQAQQTSKPNYVPNSNPYIPNHQPYPYPQMNQGPLSSQPIHASYPMAISPPYVPPATPPPSYPPNYSYAGANPYCKPLQRPGKREENGEMREQRDGEKEAQQETPSHGRSLWFKIALAVGVLVLLFGCYKIYKTYFDPNENSTQSFLTMLKTPKITDTKRIRKREEWTEDPREELSRKDILPSRPSVKDIGPIQHRVNNDSDSDAVSSEETEKEKNRRISKRTPAKSKPSYPSLSANLKKQNERMFVMKDRVEQKFNSQEGLIVEQARKIRELEGTTKDLAQEVDDMKLVLKSYQKSLKTLLAPYLHSSSPPSQPHLPPPPAKEVSSASPPAGASSKGQLRMAENKNDLIGSTRSHSSSPFRKASEDTEWKESNKKQQSKDTAEDSTKPENDTTLYGKATLLTSVTSADALNLSKQD
jgi:hypothetical protein